MSSPVAINNSINMGLLTRCKKLIQEILPNSILILYGSRARGEAREDSDYDLLILVDGEVDWKTERQVGDKIYELELQTDTLLSIQIVSLANWNSPLYKAQPFRKNVTSEGIQI